jgi:MFS family permease
LFQLHNKEIQSQVKLLISRQSFLIVDAIAMMANLLVIMRTTNLLITGRLMQGFCVGVFSSLVPLMVKEFSPLELSGSFGGLMAPSIGLGFFSAYLLSYVLNHYY